MGRSSSRGYESRIVSDPTAMDGRPLLRASRIPVETVIEELAEGLDVAAVLEEHPSLTRDDVRASLLYACQPLEAPVRSAARGSSRARRSPGRKHTAADLEAFLGSAGGWSDIDTDRFLKDIFESRDRLPGPPVSL